MKDAAECPSTGAHAQTAEVRGSADCARSDPHPVQVPYRRIVGGIEAHAMN